MFTFKYISGHIKEWITICGCTRWGLVLLANESKKESKSSTKNRNMVILSGFDILNFVIIVNVFGDCFGCLWWKKKCFHIIWFLTPCKLIFMFSEFAHLHVLFNVLETWSLLLLWFFFFLGFHFFPSDRYDMKEVIQVGVLSQATKNTTYTPKIHVVVWVRIVPTESI